MIDAAASTLLRVPPFPGARVRAIADAAVPGEQLAVDPEACVAALCRHRVGGTFWGSRPSLDPARKLVVRPRDACQMVSMLGEAARLGLGERLLLWLPDGVRNDAAGAAPAVEDPCDPWHIFDHADALWVDAGDATALLATMAGCPVLRFDGIEAVPENRTAAEIAACFLIDAVRYVDPFSGASIDALAAIALLGRWRALIDANRSIAAAVGFARWKRETVEPLLWNGSGRVRFAPATAATLDGIAPDAVLAIWKARVPSAFLAQAEAGPVRLTEVEDGFIRSSGLGANCVPPLSIVVDALGAHYDPGRPSELEALLENAVFPAEMLEQAIELRDLIQQSGLSKYEAGTATLERPAGRRRHILVTGQVEDDRSVLSGGGAIAGNLDLLKRARAIEPDAYILYKPHPDVEAGHRNGHVTEAEAQPFADAIVRDQPISALIDMVDGVHVLTSLAGFEALLRDKPVTTHGVPFYAGWGLTTDLGAVPQRRTRRLTVIELIAGVLMAYPRYLDPVTMLPCPPEVLVRRLAVGTRRQNEAIVSLRRVQGALRRKIARMGAAA